MTAKPNPPIRQTLTSEVDVVLNSASNRYVDTSRDLITPRYGDTDDVACARRLVASLIAMEQDRPDIAKANLVAAERHADKIGLDAMPPRLHWFLEYMRGDLALAEGDAPRMVHHLDIASDIALANGLDNEWLRSSANAMIALRCTSNPKSIIERLNRLFEGRGRTSTDAVFYQIVADTLNLLGRPRTALRVRHVGMGRRSKSDAWWYRNLREIARYNIALDRLADSREAFDTAHPITSQRQPHEQLLTRELEMALLLAEGRPEEVLELACEPDKVEIVPRLAVHAAHAALQLGRLDEAADYLNQVNVTAADDVARIRWYEAESRRLELHGDLVGATAAQRTALEIAQASRPPAAEINATVARIEAWLDGAPSPSRSGRLEATEGGLSDLQNALATLMLLCELGDLNMLAHAEASLAELRVLIEAMALDQRSPELTTVDLHGLAKSVLESVNSIAKHRELTLINAVPSGLLTEGPAALLELACQGICVVVSTELTAGQRLAIEAEASPVDISIVIPDATDEQHRVFSEWFETTVARGHHVAASRERLSVLGIPLARLWTVGLFASVSRVNGATRFRIASELANG